MYGEPLGNLAEACAELQLPLHVFAWRKEMRRSGLRRSALYLVRPDGYVAMADRRASPEPLRRYLAATAGFRLSKTELENRNEMTHMEQGDGPLTIGRRNAGR